MRGVGCSRLRMYIEVGAFVTVMDKATATRRNGLVAGRTELLRALFGVDAALAGDIEVGGTALRGHGPAQAAAAGLVLCPEDRKHEGVLLDFSVAQNYERELAALSIAELGIATSGPDQRTGDLSGGNQQKVVLGKWLACGPKVLLLDEPTRGVDVGARAQIYAELHRLADQGLAVLFVSSELEEVLALADRVLVVRQGAITADLPRELASEQSIMLAATSVQPAVRS